MKSLESTIRRARAIALELIWSANGVELERILDLGLPEQVFDKLALSSTAVLPRERHRIVCDYSQNRITIGAGLRPQLFISNKLSEQSSVAAATAGIFELVRSLYSGEVEGADESDLAAWIDGHLQIQGRFVSPSFISAYGSDRSMLNIHSAGNPVALGSFTALRRLVLQDG